MVIRFFATIRTATGVKEIEWGQPTPTLGELLRLLSDRYGPEFRRWALDGESLGGSVMVVINGDDARHKGGLETRLSATDVVSILPMIAGGGGTGRAVSYQRSARTRRYKKGLQISRSCDRDTPPGFRFGLIADR